MRKRVECDSVEAKEVRDHIKTLCGDYDWRCADFIPKDASSGWCRETFFIYLPQKGILLEAIENIKLDDYFYLLTGERFRLGKGFYCDGNCEKYEIFVNGRGRLLPKFGNALQPDWRATKLA